MTEKNIYTNTELFTHFTNGDTAAFEQLYRQHFNQVFYFARRFLTNIQAAEDLTTEIFLKAWNKRADFENSHKFRGFLYTSTRNACLNILKQEQQRAAQQTELIALLERDNETAREEQLLTAQLMQYVYEAIEDLPQQERKIFKLAYLEGLSNDAIAAAIGISNQSVRNAKARALKTLRLQLAQQGGLLTLFFWQLSAS
ncbi:MAG: RNA polymerase sigma-70 factor [Candidatus Pseudobacter hemicellulosilyticus]|uniref:RNA polymerase sigma-70 factor n=1 Tax=Candidatus Pseudobacter hemicellulosilyticus TaxID=3121375 RepID=A0AAJ5WSG6_9BACT|nr:MAG: RNA polymerase sigma-70 factor [Pseudobacter sp.]